LRTFQLRPISTDTFHKSQSTPRKKKTKALKGEFVRGQGKGNLLRIHPSRREREPLERVEETFD